MISTFVVAMALAVASNEPPLPPPEELAEIHKVPGPAFQIPCKVQAADLVAIVQLWVSADRGKKWTLHEEITPDKSAFTFVAKKAGEYWFAPRIKKKDGTMLPADISGLVATQRVAVANGSDSPELPPLPPPTAKSSAATIAETLNELDEELIRVELDLIRKEIKKLSEMKELTQEAEDKFDRLRSRLREIRFRHGERSRDPLVDGPATTYPPLPRASITPAPAPVPGPRITPPALVPYDERPMPAPADNLIPPSTIVPTAPGRSDPPSRLRPTLFPDPITPPAQELPVAPMPRVPERR